MFLLATMTGVVRAAEQKVTYDIVPGESSYASPKVVYFNTANGADDDYVMEFTVTGRWAEIYISPSWQWSGASGESPRYITDCPSPNSEIYTFMAGDLAASDMFGGGDGWHGPADECGGGGGRGGTTDDFHVTIGDPTEFDIRVPGDDSESLGDEFALVGERIPLQGYKHDDDDPDAELNGPTEPGDWSDPPPANTELYAAESGGGALAGVNLNNKIDVYAEASEAGDYSFTAVPSADPEGGQSGEKTLTFHALGLDIPGVDDENEEDPGGYVGVYSSVCTNSLQVVNVTLPPSRMAKDVTLEVEEGAGIVKIWKEVERSTAIIDEDASEKVWRPSPSGDEDVPLTMYVEALATSTNEVVHLKMEYANHGGNTNGWDRVRLDIIKIDVDVNTDDHPRTADVPNVSSASDIDDDDDGEEVSLGGYIWVNDDNDNSVASDSLLDYEDVTEYVDDDLEPIKYTIPQSVWDHGLAVEVSTTFADNHIKIWGGNKKNEIEESTYSTMSDFDDDGDGVLYLEGLKSGSGTISLKVVDGEETICENVIKVTVFAVAEVKWESYSSTGVSTNIGPDPGGQPDRTGVRVFPGKVSPTDTTERDKPGITVTITPEIPVGSGWHVPVAAKVYDVDHYSSGLVEGERFDDETSSRDKEGHDIGYEPNDNRTGYGETGDSHNGEFEDAGDEYDIGIEVMDVSDDTVSFSINSDTSCHWYEAIGEGGTGKAILHITEHTPCNNWRVAAGCAGSALTKPVRINNDSYGVSGDWQQDGTTLEYINDNEITIGGGEGTPSRSSETLTVWRKLHLELDRLEDVDFFEGPIKGQSVQKNDITFGSGTNTVSTELDSERTNQWEDGVARFYIKTGLIPTYTYMDQKNIDGNTAGLNVNVTVVGTSPFSSNYIVVADDDVFGFVSTAINAAPIPKIMPTVPDASLFNREDMLPAACIHAFTSTLSEFNSTDDFILNYDDLDEVRSNANEMKGGSGGIGFWVSTMISSYQRELSKSMDPDILYPNAARGTSIPYYEFVGDGVGSAVIFVETARDFAENAGGSEDSPVLRIRRTTLHECGHTLGGRHGDGALMKGGVGTNPDGGAFSGISLRRFMLLRDKGPSD